MENNEKEHVNKNSSTGLTENVAGALTYLLGFITGIIFLVIEKENHFVRFHAFQSIFISAVLLIISVVLSMIPLIGWLLSLLLSPLSFILWILLMYWAYQGKRTKLPFVGDIADQQVNK
ncbi:DUF4870 domain-containing protein [Halalkalibacillus halophilus]|uniref:DUF4870 domain-containing protein n=1 Tax=Halalkalibacillus halophilus TaxID=392827 RepID=UPI00040A1261|nr:DUF4870 domain-containing protein [Halalkalibacillus halophilus]